MATVGLKGLTVALGLKAYPKAAGKILIIVLVS